MLVDDQGQEYMVRLNDKKYSTVIDADAEVYGSHLVIEEIRFYVVKKTPKGAWVRTGSPNGWGGTHHFVLTTPGGKRLCYPTYELAALSLIARKQRAIRIMQHRIRDAEYAMELTNKKYLQEKQAHVV